MITELSLRNFKAHRATEVKLGRLTVLVGPNAAGKTSLLQAIALIGLRQNQKTKDEDLFRAEHEPSILLTRGQEGPLLVGLRGATAGGEWEAKLLFETLAFGPPWTPSFERTWEGGHNWPRNLFERELDAVTIFRFDPSRIAAPGNSVDPKPRVKADGANTAPALAALKIDEDGHFAMIEEGLRRLVPSVKRLRVRPAQVVMKGGTVGGHQVVFDFNQAADVPAFAASEGTLVTLALLTAIHAPNRPRLVLIDDLERALHPLAQMELMRQLKALVDTTPDLQIIATTHSPYILHGLDPAQVLVFFPREDGSIAVRPLSEHPDAERAKGTLSAGEIWSLDPEDWVLGERASA
jgi:predicted ATPase